LSDFPAGEGADAQHLNVQRLPIDPTPFDPTVRPAVPSYLSA